MKQSSNILKKATHCVANCDILLDSNLITFVTHCVTNLNPVGTVWPIIGYRPARAGCAPALVPARGLPVGRIPQCRVRPADRLLTAPNYGPQCGPYV